MSLHGRVAAEAVTPKSDQALGKGVGPVDRTAYECRLKNLHSWAGHLEATIETAIPQALVELGPPGNETSQDIRNAAEALRDVSKSLDNLMNAYDLLLDAVDRPRRYDDFLQGLDADTDPMSEADGEVEGDADGDSLEVNRTRLTRLSGELHYDVGWLLGARSTAP